MSNIVYFPTNNVGKYDRYKKSFEKSGVDYNRYYINSEGNEVKIEIEENGKTTRENAEKKAKGYYEEYKKIMPNQNFIVMTTDEALYIDGLEDGKQPKERVRRFDGLERATDMQVVDKYTDIVKKLGGRANALWKYSLVTYNGKEYHYLDWDEPVLFCDIPHEPIPKGYVLDSITIVSENELGTKTMLSELSSEKKFDYLSKYTDEVAKFVKNNTL